jgi:AraC-like DNA-binding protein
MLENRHDVITKFIEPVYSSHPVYNPLLTFTCLENWENDITIDLPHLKIQIHTVDYIDQSQIKNHGEFKDILRFQQDVFRLWYQVDGYGILQNVTRKSFGSARPGLLGVMERGERHTYMHQKGTFSCFLLQFSLFPSISAKCYWNAGIEGKTILEVDERFLLESYIYDFFLTLSRNNSMLGIATLSRLLDIFAVLFKKKLILIEESRFPKNKGKSLAVKAKNFMDIHYSTFQHQDQLENECGVDVNYLNILFKKEFGKTLYQYMTSVRMEHAKHFLETTENSISDIATLVGYPNANSFSRAFRRRAHMTPNKYRSGNKMRKK